MKQLLVFTVIVLAISSLPLFEDHYGPYWSENRFKGVLQEAYNSSASIHHRSIRSNVDNLKAPLERLQRIARITNGIHLLKELIAGKIPADELISELLFFGPVTPSDISAIDTQKVQMALNTLENLPKGLEATSEIEKTEKTFNGLNQVLSAVDGIGNLAEWTEGKQNFKDEITKLATDGIKTTSLTTIQHDVTGWKLKHELLKNDGAAATKKTFEELKSSLESFKDAATKFTSATLDWKFNKLNKSLDGISPLLKAADGSALFITLSADLEVSDDMKAAYNSLLDATTSKLDSINQVNPILQTVRDFVVSKRSKNRQRPLKHTHGLSQGATDVTSMLNNVGDVWIRKIVTTDALKTAFKKFDSINSVLNELDSSLQFDEKGVSNIDGLFKHASFINVVFSDVKNIKLGIEQSNACKRPTTDKMESKDFDELKKTLKQLDERLDNIKEHSTKLSEALKAQGLSEMCDDIIGICNDAQTADNIQDSVVKFQKYGKFDNLHGNLTKIDEIITDIKKLKPEDAKTDAATAEGKFGALDTYHTKLNHYAEYFNCLQEKKELKLVFGLMAGIEKIRNLKSVSFQNGLDVVEKVTGAKNKLETLKKAIDEMRSTKTTETDDFNDFKDAGKHSKVIGEAVQGVANMKNALDEKRKTVDRILNNLQLVRDNQKLLTDPTDVKNLQELTGLEPSIQSMYSTLDTFIGGVKDNESPVLKNHSDLFKSAKSVSGVTGDFLAMISSVENLKQKIPGSNNLEELQTSLKVMDAMGLDFTKYQTSFDNSDSLLGDLDVAFANFNKRMARKTPPTTQQQGAASGSQGSGNNKKEKKDESTNTVTYIAGSAVGAVLGAFVVSGFFFVWRPWKKNRNMKRFLDYLLNDLRFRYINLEKNGLTEKKAVEALFGNAILDDKSGCKDNVVIQNKLCEKEECDVNSGMVKETAMVLKGYGDLFKSEHYHAVVVPISKKKKIIMSHVPTKLSKETPETVAKFYWMAKQYRSETIVSLDPSGKLGEVDPGKAQQKVEYIPAKKGDSVTCENVIIECLEMEVISDKKKYPELKGVIEKRKLKVTLEKQQPFTVNLIWCSGWPDEDSLEVETSDLVYVLNMIEKDKTPPIIVSYRLRKAEALTFVLFARILIRKNSGITLKAILQQFSESSFDCFPYSMPYRASILLLFDFLTQDKKVKVKDEANFLTKLKNPSDDPCEAKAPPKNDGATKTEDPSKTEDSAKTGGASKTGDPSKSEVPSKNEVAPKK